MAYGLATTLVWAAAVRSLRSSIQPGKAFFQRTPVLANVAFSSDHVSHSGSRSGVNVAPASR
jgi:hypothetical protein